jgi:hypothetical protein
MSLNPSEMEQIEMLSGFTIVGCDIEPMLGKQCVFGMLDRHLCTVAHHHGKGHEIR